MLVKTQQPLLVGTNAPRYTSDYADMLLPPYPPTPLMEKVKILMTKKSQFSS